MQSIYQFREAEVGLFLRARDYGVGEIAFEPLQLRRNFRSSAALIAWVNAHFTRLFPADDDARRAAIRYLPSVPAAPEDSAPDAPEAPEAPDVAQGAVTLHRLHAGDRVAEAARVVQIVRAARARDAQAAIAVLVASREHVALSAAQLRAAGFALRGVDLERLGDRPVIRDLAALTRALLHAADRSAWLALLRAPWCGLSLAELEALLPRADTDMFRWLQSRAAPPHDGANQAQSSQDRRAASDETAEATRLRVSRLCKALAPAILGPERALALWQRVEHCWLRLAGPAIHRAEVDRLDAHRFIDTLALHDDPERLVGEALAELTERLYSGAPPQSGAIELMTVHAAKGLEWDVVILPGLGRRTAVDRDPLLHWIELPRASAGTDLLLAPIRSTEQEPRVSLAAYIKRLRRERSRLERVRLMYVAATRARTALHLLADLPLPARAGQQPAPRAGSLLDLLWPAIGEQFQALTPVGAVSAATLESWSDAATAVTDADRTPLWRLPARWSVAQPPASALAALRRLRLASPDLIEPPEYRWVGLSARAVGTIVHAELHRLATAAELPAATAPGVLPDYGGWLAELGVAADERAGASARVQQALQRTLADPRGRWLLSGAHREARSEWRLTGLHEGRVVNIIIDRMLVDDAGQRWIVDFKTSTHEGGAEREFVDREADRYRPQLLRYAALAAQLGRQPVRLALYFPLLGVFRELDAAAS